MDEGAAIALRQRVLSLLNTHQAVHDDHSAEREELERYVEQLTNCFESIQQPAFEIVLEALISLLEKGHEFGSIALITLPLWKVYIPMLKRFGELIPESTRQRFFVVLMAYCRDGIDSILDDNLDGETLRLLWLFAQRIVATILYSAISPITILKNTMIVDGLSLILSVFYLVKDNADANLRNNAQQALWKIFFGTLQEQLGAFVSILIQYPSSNELWRQLMSLKHLVYSKLEEGIFSAESLRLFAESVRIVSRLLAFPSSTTRSYKLEGEIKFLSSKAVGALRSKSKYRCAFADWALFTAIGALGVGPGLASVARIIACCILSRLSSSSQVLLCQRWISIMTFCSYMPRNQTANLHFLLSSARTVRQIVLVADSSAQVFVWTLIANNCEHHSSQEGLWMQAEALEYILMEFPYTCLAGKKEAGLLATISAQILIALDVSDTQRIGALCSVVNSIVRLSRIPPMLDSVVVAFADCKKIGTFLLKCINVLSTHAESIVQSHAGRLTTSSIRQLVRMLRAIAFSADCLKRYKLPDAVLVVLSRSLSTLVAMMSLVGLHGLSSDLAGRGVLAALAIFDTLSRNSCSQNLMDEIRSSIQGLMITIAKTNSKFSQSHCRAIIVGRIADISGWARHEVEKMLRSVSLPLSDYVAIENDAQTREVMARYLLYCDLAKSPINE